MRGFEYEVTVWREAFSTRRWVKVLQIALQ
jgi:hypothetical protein